MYLKLFIVVAYLLASSKLEILGSAENSTVFQRGLSVRNATKTAILNNHNSYYSYTNDTRTMKDVLGFLEISNDNSFLEASHFASKFSMFSPYELRVRRIGIEKYDISGTPLIRLTKKWVGKLIKSGRNNNKNIRILSLVRFSNWKTTDILSLISSYQEMMTLSKQLLKVCEKNHLDGLILDIWSGFYGKMPTSSVLMLIQEISARLRFDMKQALVIIPSMYANADVINKETFEAIVDYANYIVLEMFDYSSTSNPGPNSPIVLVEDFVKYLTPDPLVRRSSVLIGVNFFGNAFTSSGMTKITRSEYLELLQNYDKDELDFDADGLEHYFETSIEDEDVLVYYPSLYSIHCRVRLANKLGVGLAVVKLGEGLEYFYDVL